MLLNVSYIWIVFTCIKVKHLSAVHFSGMSSIYALSFKSVLKLCFGPLFSNLTLSKYYKVSGIYLSAMSSICVPIFENWSLKALKIWNRSGFFYLTITVKIKKIVLHKPLRYVGLRVPSFKSKSVSVLKLYIKPFFPMWPWVH